MVNAQIAIQASLDELATSGDWRIRRMAGRHEASPDPAAVQAPGHLGKGVLMKNTGGCP